ncbi:MAG: hypothetical protein EZS28_010997 [Streblomastix strix]|uniref:Uncharacterized protein n=1 Tax=Streblomastix strix TaxID=222440 RepID=A0A5J4WES1_9EUKA|nr:MAG: hypothetical protein EZS28_010997 [Streblomastix strix]
MRRTDRMMGKGQWKDMEFENGFALFFDCKNPLATTPETVCACPTDTKVLAIDPRKDTICKKISALAQIRQIKPNGMPIQGLKLKKISVVLPILALLV